MRAEARAHVCLPDVLDVTARGERVVITGGAGAVLSRLVALGVTARALRVDSPTLDDAYLSLIRAAHHDTTEALPDPKEPR